MFLPLYICARAALAAILGKDDLHLLRLTILLGGKCYRNRFLVVLQTVMELLCLGQRRPPELRMTQRFPQVYKSLAENGFGSKV